MEEKRNWKEEIKDFWKEKGDTIKIVAGCLTGGFLVGFAKGVLTESKLSQGAFIAILDKYPNALDDD